jgi:hypothetical protein
MPLLRPRRLAAALLLALSLTAPAGAVPSVVPTGVFHPWAKAEFRIDGVPVAENNFDPDQIAIDATITSPSGRALTVPAFWYQDFSRSMERGAESVAPLGPPRWLLRYTPTEPGEFRLVLRWRLAGLLAPDAADSAFTVVPGSSQGRTGWVRVGPDHRYFETSDGRPLRFIGANVCWPEGGGTYDYDRWFGRMADAGENYARLWLCPWWAGIEHKPGTLNRYPLADAWRLDHVFDLADEKGIYVLLSLDHHGMYQVVNKGWGGRNNFWPTNPYSSLQGGPCATPDEFFTGGAARDIYRKRLRYLVARYGYSPRLVAWQFFNEIDNTFTQGVDGAHVVAWHREMGDWLRAHDPYGHLITTSLTGGSDRPEVWNLPEMDFAEYHSYVDPALGSKIASLSKDFVRRYRKPVMIGEFGVNAATWSIALDPYLRGFRQGLWSGALGGSAGTSMSWWWQDLDKDDVYPLYSALSRILGEAGWGSGEWGPAELAPRPPAPAELGPDRPEAEVFDAALALNAGRRLRLPGTAVIASPLAAERSSERLSAYLYGAKNPGLSQGLRVTADFADRARIVVGVKSATSDNDVIVRLEGAEVFRRHFPRSDPKLRLGNVRAVEFDLGVPSGRQTLEIANVGADFTLLDSVRLERVRNVGFARGWEYGPEVAALRSGDKAVVYVASPWVVYPAGALRYHPPQVEAASLTILAWPAGPVRADWFSPVDGRSLGSTTARASGGAVEISIPDFNEDLVGVVRAL